MMPRPQSTDTSMSATPTSEITRSGLAGRYGAGSLDQPNFRNSTIVKIRGLDRTASSQKVDCVPHHAVLIAPGLRLASPKNGNISNVGRRLSAISLPSCSNWEYRDGLPIHKKPQLAGTYRISWATISS